jgi:RimJ/RimL family protein N-acetyltransferase
MRAVTQPQEHGDVDHDHPKLFATVDENNLASRRVLEKVGMAPLRREEDDDGAWWVYSHRA